MESGQYLLLVPSIYMYYAGTVFPAEDSIYTFTCFTNLLTTESTVHLADHVTLLVCAMLKGHFSLRNLRFIFPES